MRWLGTTGDLPEVFQLDPDIFLGRGDHSNGCSKIQKDMSVEIEVKMRFNSLFNANAHQKACCFAAHGGRWLTQR
jgi:hypothetical protein